MIGDGGKGRARRVDHAAKITLPAGIAFGTEGFEPAILDDRGGAQQGAGDGVDPADMAVKKVCGVDRLAADLGIKVEAAIGAQVLNTYIVAEHSTGLWLIEQHIAHERVLYEQICTQWRLVPLEPGIILQSLTTTQLEQLQRLGLEIDPFGEGVWVVRNAPELLAKRSDCSDALLEISLGGDLQAAQVATACRSAIKNGTPMTLIEMQTLLDQWIKTRNPRTCPHGRPIVLQLEESSLSRFFRRHWVIGKSHGI